jgi:hypothetical protein
VFGILAYRELDRERPRGLVGMTDISARKNVRATLGENVLSFTAPHAFPGNGAQCRGNAFSDPPGALCSNRKNEVFMDDVDGSGFD